MDFSDPIKASTPVGKLNTSRPLPVFPIHNQQMFQFKKHKQSNNKSTLLRSPFKTAPPVSRVNPWRKNVYDKLHAVSFRTPTPETLDSTLCSKYYDAESSELYFKQCFIIEKKLGEGSFGEVLQVRSRDNNKKYAIKRSREKFKNESDRRRKLDEVKKHENLPTHPNCVKFIKAWEERKRLYIQTELCSTSLQAFLEKHHSIPIYFIWKYFIDLLRGLHHIHSHGLIHFDVKPANIFLSEDKTCKIGDFGLVVDCCNDDLINAQEGDNKYMAPELLRGVFSEKADVFSLGIAMLEISCDLELPSCGASWQLLRSGELPTECRDMIPFSLFSIIQWMMAPCHNLRPTIYEVLSHPIVKSYNQRLSVNFFLNHCFFKLIKTVSSALSYFTYLVKLPFLNFYSFSSNECNKTSSSLNNDLQLDDSSATEDEISAPKLSPNFSDSFDYFNDNSIVATPPMTPIGLHIPPTPKNSSPISYRSAIQIATDLSPLPQGNKKEFFNKKNYVDDFDFFVEDHDMHVDHSERENLVLSPRNLLNMLNEVSDSDSS